VSIANLSARRADALFQDLREEHGTVALFSSNSTLFLERCRVRNSTTREPGAVSLGEATSRLSSTTSSLAALQAVTFAGIQPAGKPRLAVARRTSGTFYSDAEEQVFDRDQSVTLPTKRLDEAPLTAGVFASGLEPRSPFDVLRRVRAAAARLPCAACMRRSSAPPWATVLSDQVPVCLRAFKAG